MLKKIKHICGLFAGKWIQNIEVFSKYILVLSILTLSGCVTIGKDSSDSERGKRSSTVFISYKGTSKFCSGVFISTDVVLTAAHCICSSEVESVTLGTYGGFRRSDNVYKVKTGSYKAWSCNKSDHVSGKDLGIIVISSPDRNVKYSEIADSIYIDKAKKFLVVGYGTVNQKGTEFAIAGLPRKREAVIPSVTNNCIGNKGKHDFTDIFGCFKGSEIVAGGPNSADSCSGDSGGPLFVSRNGSKFDLDSEIMLAGIVSRSIKRSAIDVKNGIICGRGGIYVRINDDAKRFIRKSIRDLKGDTPEHLYRM